MSSRPGGPLLRAGLVVVLAWVAGACGSSQPGPPAPGAGTNGIEVPVGPSSGAASGVRAPGGGNVPLPQPSTSTAAAQPSPSLGHAPVVAARRAVDDWLAALGHADAAAMLAQSTGAAAALGSVEVVTDIIVSAGGGTRGTEVGLERLKPTRVSSTAVAFGGEIDLEVTISGRASPFRANEVITGPVLVVKRSGDWKVKSFSFGGKPMTYYPEGVRRTVKGIRLSVAFALNHGTSTSVVVGLASPRANTTVYLDRVAMELSSGATVAGKAFFGHGLQTGLLGFPRVAARPVRLTVTFRERTGSPIELQVPLSGRPS